MYAKSGLGMTLCKKYHFNLFVTQLFGHAGRGGFLCRAVLLTDAREVQCCKDIGLVKFCTEKENCRRKQMLRAIGSDEPLQTVNGRMCCDVCSQQCSNKGSACTDLDTVDMCKHICCKGQRKPPAVRTVSKDHSESLKLEEREKIILPILDTRCWAMSWFCQWVV